MTDLVGVRLDLPVGPVAHGGHCVARVPPDGGEAAGLVVFVRHTLPGERVIAEVTEVRPGYLRADAVEVIAGAPQRVAPPCPYARPGACGGCDFQHVTLDAQRELKAAVVREQLTRLGRLRDEEIDALDVRVRELPGGGLGWRTRVRYAVSAEGRAGLLKHRSHEVVPVDRCLIAHQSIQALPVTDQLWPTADEVATVASGGGEVAVLAIGRDGAVERIAGPYEIHERAAGRRWALPPGTFWQVHPAAAQTLATAVTELLAPRGGESAWDLYGGAGLFAAALAEAAGPDCAITLVESDPAGAVAARRNLADLQVQVVTRPVEKALRSGLDPPDLVVLDPPRSGAGARVVREIMAAGPRAVAYVACDPAAFARDVATFRAGGWRLAELRAFDCFPMTHHVECVGLLLPG